MTETATATAIRITAANPIAAAITAEIAAEYHTS